MEKLNRGEIEIIGAQIEFSIFILYLMKELLVEVVFYGVFEKTHQVKLFGQPVLNNSEAVNRSVVFRIQIT